MAKTTGLASLAEGRSDMFRIDPRKIKIKVGWNGRDMSAIENQEHVDQLARSIAEVGVKEPITVVYENGEAWVSDGHCRLLATMRAIEQYGAGDKLKTILVKSEDRYSDEADRIFSQILRNSGKPFTQLEQARTFKKLLDFGWDQKAIAAKSGYSGGRVSQILSLLTLPPAVKEMVQQGQVSATMAVQTVKASHNGTEAEQKLRDGLAKAISDGKDKVTAAHMPVAPQAEWPKVNIKKEIKEAFEYADIDDSDEDVVVVKFPMDKFEILRKLLEL